MDRAQIEARVREILGNYRVNQKWVPSQRGRLYAVYSGPNVGRMRPNPGVEQVGEPMSSKEANQFKNDLIVADLLDLIENIKESNNHVHQE